MKTPAAGKRRGLPPAIWRAMKIGPQAAYAVGLGPIIGGMILLLTTTGRRSGLRRVTPLQYEAVGDALIVGSARGQQADWVRNIAADPHVEVRVGSQQYDATAEIVTDMQRIVEFLELRLRRHPRMVGAMLRADGLSIPPERAELEAYAARLVMVVIRPDRKAQDARE